jgi:V/A-type H+-transporting ATPase subunit A
MADRGQAPWAFCRNEASLNEIVQLVGKDALSPADQLTLETARMIREDFLQQNAFTDIDGYSSYDRQEKLLGMILSYDKLCRDAIAKGAQTCAKLFAIPAREKIGRAKSVPADKYAAAYAEIAAEMEAGDRKTLPLKGGED